MSRTSVPPVHEGIARAYGAALSDYLSGAGEDALMRAYEVGRAAVAAGLGVVDLVAMHGSSLQAAIAGAQVEESRAWLGTNFLAESLSPFEMTHRGFKEANARLEEANRELETFGYSVSHDLRAPLRAIDGFSRILLEEHSAELGTEAREHLKRIVRSAERMKRLIDELLEFSRIARAEVKRQSIDLSATSLAVLEELRAEDPARTVATAVEEGLLARADAALVRVVLENLLRNAWKFSAKRSPARIEVGRLADAGAGAAAFFVRDDGAGFDATRAERLFAPFQRFHSEAEFPGTGIGLATVHRVVARHQGKIWAESAVGRGTTVFFTLESES